MKFYPQAINGAAINAALNAAGQLSFNGNLTLAPAGYLGWSGNFVLRPTGSGQLALRNFAETVSVELAVEANDILAQRRGTNSQTLRLYNTFTDASNYERISVGWSGNLASIGIDSAGTGSQRDLRIGNSTYMTFETGSGTAAITRSATSAATIFRVETSGGMSSTAINFARLLPIINQASGTYTVLDINPTETTIGAGPHYLIKGRLGAGNNVFSFNRTGDLTLGDVVGGGVMLHQVGGTLLQILRADGVTIAGIQVGSSRHSGMTVSGAGSASGIGSGGLVYVTDLSSTTRGATATGGGSLKGFIWSDGTNWIVM